MENVLYRLTIIQNKQKKKKEAGKGIKIWREEVRRSERESKIIPTEVPPWVNKWELIGKSDELTTSSLQNGTLRGYLL